MVQRVTVGGEPIGSPISRTTIGTQQISALVSAHHSPITNPDADNPAEILMIAKKRKRLFVTID